MAAVKNCMQKVNNSTMTVRVGTGSSTTYTSEFVVYTGIDEINISYTMSGSQRFDVSHNFLCSPVNMNFEYNANSTATDIVSRYERVTPAKYLQADFTTLGI